MAPNDGTYAEDIVKTELNKHVSSDFMWRRLYDTKSAQLHTIQAQPADFECVYKGRPFFIEVKTVGHKLGRLPQGSFSQRALMQSWSKAGFRGFVLVHAYNFDGELYLVDVDDIQPDLKSWVIPELGIIVNVDTFLQEIIKRL